MEMVKPVKEWCTHGSHYIRGDGYGTFFWVVFQNQVNPFLFDAEYCSEQESAKKMNFRLLFFCVDHF